jgi:hypothetical protein
MCDWENPIDFEARTYTLDGVAYTLGSYYRVHSAWVNLYAGDRPSWKEYMAKYGILVTAPKSVASLASLFSLPTMRSARR